jgi:hypothetical protein
MNVEQPGFLMKLPEDGLEIVHVVSDGEKNPPSIDTVVPVSPELGFRIS